MNRNTKFFKRIISIMVMTTITLSLLAGCGTKKAAVVDGGKEEPTPISIMSVFYSTGPIANDNVIVKEFEKRTNTKLDITWVAGNSYNEKLSVTLASGDMPDMTLDLETYNAQWRSMTSQGAFWEVGKYYKDYKNLAALPAEIWENTKLADGKNYMMPRPRPLDGQSAGQLNVRKDWLDNLGLKVPETMDDLYAVMKAFTNDDPDKNGKKDTVGFAGYVNDGDLGSLKEVVSIFNGAGNDGFKLDKNKKMAQMWTDTSTRDALVWLRKAYLEGLIHKDIAVLKPEQESEIVMASKSGISFSPMQKTTVYDATIKKTVPNAETLPLIALSSNNGKYIGRSGGSFGGFVIPKTVKEDKMKKIMAFYDFCVSNEGWELAKYGVEGVHFNKSGDKYTVLPQAKIDLVGTMTNVSQKYDKYQTASMAGTTPLELDRNKKIIDEKAKISIPSPNVGLYSDTESKIGADYNKKYSETFMKVMLGAEPIATWDAYVAKLKTDADYLKWVKEISDAYDKKMSVAK
ncbi:extracellular solute-binding protein [Clostridium lacusfryxellense]|uniref:extracellular solute-binding protein n=1 Tax=Clostridium lacusfryxellense TaxID=205328 RepID=UPI001C0D94AF|nr:extracellular solute-binding protein [Clostridium lacusfryxellense]MBU3114837.1 extracellular solute-binding protein [Clostridium lacusfryxellense]